MHLQEDPGRHSGLFEVVPDGDHGELHEVRGGPLDGGVDRRPESLFLLRARDLPVKLGKPPDASEHRPDLGVPDRPVPPVSAHRG